MLFNSLVFLIFFPIVVIVYFVIPQQVKNLWLLLASYYFYMNWNPKYIILLLFSTGITYLGGLALDHMERRGKSAACKKACLAAVITANLAMLFAFKYFQFALGYMNRLLSMLHMASVESGFDPVLPVGISFFTFQALGYIIDVYRKDVPAEKNLLQYALFIAFFPQLVAGPIERSQNMLKQIKVSHKFDYNRARNGILLMLWGFFLKLVIADRAAFVVNAVYGDPLTYGGYYLVVATVLFAFQIYCDFAGYSTIAKGAAMVLGFQLMENFHAPYLATSVADHWRRWHLSMSNWFRDYLYIPLGGNRKGLLRKYGNILIVFAVSGLWHGASFSYVLWGTINGCYQVIEDLISRMKKWISGKLGFQVYRIKSRLVKCVFTFILLIFSLVFFRAGDMEQVKLVLTELFSKNNPWILFDGSLYQLGVDEHNFMVLIIAIILLMIVDYFHDKGIHLLSVWEKQNILCRVAAVTLLFYGVILFGIYGVDYDISTFIYFAF